MSRVTRNIVDTDPCLPSTGAPALATTGKPEIGTPLGGIALELGLASALRQRLLTQRWCRRQYIRIFMRRNNKAEVEFNIKKYKLMDFQNAQFCNAKFGFKDFADSSSLAYCGGWMRASATLARRTRMHGALRQAGHVIRFRRCRINHRYRIGRGFRAGSGGPRAGVALQLAPLTASHYCLQFNYIHLHVESRPISCTSTSRFLPRARKSP